MPAPPAVHSSAPVVCQARYTVLGMGQQAMNKADSSTWGPVCRKEAWRGDRTRPGEALRGPLPAGAVQPVSKGRVEGSVGTSGGKGAQKKADVRCQRGPEAGAGAASGEWQGGDGALALGLVGCGEDTGFVPSFLEATGGFYVGSMI